MRSGSSLEAPSFNAHLLLGYKPERSHRQSSHAGFSYNTVNKYLKRMETEASREAK